MKRSARLQPIQNNMEAEMNDAAAEMGRARGNLQAAISKLEQLMQFKDEYQGRFKSRLTAGLAPARIRDFQSFLSRLDAAIDAQRREIKGCEQVVDVREQAWRALRARAKAIGAVVERYKTRELHDQLRQEQKDMDEFAMRRFQQH